MKYILHKVLLTGITTGVCGLGLLLVSSPVAAAYAYNPSDLISDTIFTNTSSMGTGGSGVQAIQNFLVSENSGLKNYSDTENCGSTSGSHYSYYATYYRCGSSQSAAQIIYDVAQAYSINPQVIMATLQKEQSLITTPNPTSSQLNCAMGYNSCSGYVGFFSQVDNGTWQFKTYIELMDGNNWWGYTPSSYPCRNSTSLYSAALYPGATVTFANPGGAAQTVTLADSATAALYCYTPYVGPYSLTGYSGSYNFVQSFEQWFGSTVYPYAGQVTVNTYSDAAHTQPLSLSGALPSGTQIYVTVSAVNTGSQTWQNWFTRIGTSGPNDRSSAFHDGSWVAYNRPANLMQASVTPEQTGTFQFSLTTPNTDGEYHEQFDLVADQQTNGWMQDNATFGFDITVTNPFIGSITQLDTYRDSTYTQHTDPGALTPGKQVYIRLNVLNTGTQTWNNSFTHIATISPQDRTSAFSDASWTSSNRPATLQQSTVLPGQVGTFQFSITAPNAPGSYNEQFGLVADGQSGGWMPAPSFGFPIQVISAPLDTLYNGLHLYTGESIQSKNGQYSLTLQYDGNLVVWSPMGPIWNSGTNGRGVAFAGMQTDGNLVLYDGSNRPVWGSGTAGRGPSNLFMQNDGNVVMYTSGGTAYWGTGTDHNIANTPVSLSSGGQLPAGGMLLSPNRQYRAIMQTDGNLVIYSPHGAVWGSGTDNTGANVAIMQTDGNLVIYSPSRAYWGSGTNGHGSSKLIMQNDGNLVVYDAGGHATWASGTIGR